jgi:hypothetical protein
MRLWFYGDDFTSKPSEYAACHRHVGYSGSDWTIENGALGHVRAFYKQITEEQEALLRGGEEQ